MIHRPDSTLPGWFAFHAGDARLQTKVDKTSKSSKVSKSLGVGGFLSYLSTGEAARMCGVGVNSIKRWICQGRLSCIQTPGGHWRIPREDFLRFMATLRPKASEPARVPRVLIIDDDVQACDILRAAMASGMPFACETECAHDGYTGLIQIGRLRPDLLVLDIMMPEINGLELLHRLHASPELSRDMKIMVFTGAGDRSLVMRKVEQCHPDAILLKPVGAAEFLQVVTSLLHPQPESKPLPHLGQG